MPYQSAKYYRMPGQTPAPGKNVLIQSGTIPLFVPVKFDQDVSITTIGFVCGATVSGGKAQCAVYASDPTNRYASGSPIVTSADANAATLNNNGNFILSATWNALKDTIYWLGILGSTNGVGFAGSSCAEMLDEIGGTGMGDESLSGEINGCVSISGGGSYASPASSWTNLVQPGAGRGASVAYAPMLFFKTA